MDGGRPQGVGAGPLKGSGGPHAALILARRRFWAGKGKRKRKGFLLWLLYLVHIKQGQAGVLLFVFSLFSGRMTDGSWRCRRPVLQG